jgi:hypothetical protein
VTAALSLPPQGLPAAGRERMPVPSGARLDKALFSLLPEDPRP